VIEKEQSGSQRIDRACVAGAASCGDRRQRLARVPPPSQSIKGGSSCAAAGYAERNAEPLQPCSEQRATQCGQRCRKASLVFVQRRCDNVGASADE